MPRGSHRPPPDRRNIGAVAAAIIAAAVIGVSVWFLFFRDGRPGQGERGVPTFSFEVGRVGATAVSDRADEATLNRAAKDVRRTLDDLYVAGFLDPARWQGGTFPDVLDKFAEEAATKARDDLDLLTLGADATRIEYMEPRQGRLNVRFLVDAEQTPTAAVATTNFIAAGELAAGGPVYATHDATYYLEADGKRWLIVGYDVEGTVQPGDLPGEKTQGTS